MSRRMVFWSLAAWLAAQPARAADVELRAEGYAFTLRDTVTPFFGDSFTPNDPVLRVPAPFALDGLGFRASGTFAFDGGESRAGVVVQRVSDAATHSGSRPIFDGVAFEHDERVEATLTSIEARVERRVVSAERFELRVQAGYRYARVSQEQALSGACPVCALPRGLLPNLAASSSVDAHGLRSGLATRLRLASRLSLETEAGLSLLAASEDVDSGFTHDSFDLLSGVAPTIFPPRVEGRGLRRSLATWDAAVRLRAEWSWLSLSAGYRFERWSELPGPVLLPGGGQDGFTLGVGVTAGRS